MRNLTLLEDETFGNLDPTDMSQSVYLRSTFREVFFITAEIIRIFICACSAGASVFLISVYLKFENIRQKTSVFLLHYAIGCCIDMLLLPVMNLTIELSLNTGPYWKQLCIIYTISDSIYILVFVFGTALGVYWFIQSFKQNWLQRVPNFQIYFTVACYAVSFVKISVNVFDCFLIISSHTSHLLIAFYLFFATVLTVINTTVYKFETTTKTVQKTKYQLDISNYIVFSYAPLLICSYVLTFFVNNAFFYFVEFVFCFAQFLAYSGPVVVVYLLGRKSKYFKAAYRGLFKRSARSYEEEDMDDESESNAAENVGANLNDVEFSNDAAFSIVI